MVGISFDSPIFTRKIMIIIVSVLMLGSVVIVPAVLSLLWRLLMTWIFQTYSGTRGTSGQHFFPMVGGVSIVAFVETKIMTFCVPWIKSYGYFHSFPDMNSTGVILVAVVSGLLGAGLYLMVHDMTDPNSSPDMI